MPSIVCDQHSSLRLNIQPAVNGSDVIPLLLEVAMVQANMHAINVLMSIIMCAFYDLR